MANRDIFNKMSRLENELYATISQQKTSERNKRMDDLVEGLASPRTQERLRIFKLVENQFNDIEQQVKDEVASRLEKQKQEKSGTVPIQIRADGVLKRAENLRKQESRKKVTSYKVTATPKVVSPKKQSKKVVSFKEKIKNDEKTVKDSGTFKVLQNTDINHDLIPMGDPVIIDMSERGVENQGLFQMKHVENRPSNNKIERLSCHRLPGVNIRPGLVVENIPGLSFEGYSRKPNQRITVEHVVSVDPEEDIDEKSEVKDISICPTDSTTSKFEEMEKMLKGTLQQKAKPVNIQRYVTKNELLDIERELIKKKLPQILQDFQQVSERMTPRNNEQNLKEKVNVPEITLNDDSSINCPSTHGMTEDTLIEKSNKENIICNGRVNASETLESIDGKDCYSTEVVKDNKADKSLNSEEKYSNSFESNSSETKTTHSPVLEKEPELRIDNKKDDTGDKIKSPEDKYTTSFESNSTKAEKDNTASNSSKSKKSLLKTLSHFSENFTDENETVCSEAEELSPDPSIHQQVPENMSRIPCDAESPHSEQKVDIEAEYLPPVLSTIEEVTSVITSEQSSPISGKTIQESNLSLDVEENDLIPDVDEIDFELESRGELTPDVLEIDFENSSHKEESQKISKEMKLRQLNMKSVHSSETELDTKTNSISLGGKDENIIDSYISTSESNADPEMTLPVPQEAPTPYKPELDHFVVSESQSERRGEDISPVVGSVVDKDSSMPALEEGRLSSEEELFSPKILTPNMKEIAFNQDSGRLTQDVDDINLPAPSINVSDIPGDFHEISLPDKKTDKVFGDEITLDVESIVTEAEVVSGGQTGKEFNRQDTEDTCDSDPISFQRQISEGEVVLLLRDHQSSEGEIHMGLSREQDDQDVAGVPGPHGVANIPGLHGVDRIQRENHYVGGIPGLSIGARGDTNEGDRQAGDYYGDISASEGEAGLRVVKRRNLQATNRLRRDKTAMETSTSSSSGLSEGEWRASHSQMQRFLNMAAAFRMVNKE